MRAQIQNQQGTITTQTAKITKLEAESDRYRNLSVKTQQDLDFKTANFQKELSDELGRLADCEQQRDTWKADHKSVSNELERFKNAQAAKDKLAGAEVDD